MILGGNWILPSISHYPSFQNQHPGDVVPCTWPVPRKVRRTLPVGDWKNWPHKKEMPHNWHFQMIKTLLSRKAGNQWQLDCKVLFSNKKRRRTWNSHFFHCCFEANLYLGHGWLIIFIHLNLLVWTSRSSWFKHWSLQRNQVLDPGWVRHVAGKVF